MAFHTITVNALREVKIMCDMFFLLPIYKEKKGPFLGPISSHTVGDIEVKPSKVIGQGPT